ncbi:MAG: TetR/AcrR family transcriptional regulator [Treponema sp.]|nr:TetR/AcrR family transcriptional regulator [Treponema sp.]
MGKPETDLAPRIREKTLELLLEKEPEEISTRDIAKACGVTATSLYYYYKDKETLFTEVKLCCVEKMDKFISGQVTKKTLKSHKSGKRLNPFDEVRIGLTAFRDWAFTNPRIALLVMGRLKADIREDPEKMNKYYQSYFLAKVLLDKAVKAGLSDSKDTLLDVSLCIAALWGAIESVLLNRTIPQYWPKRGGLNFTNKMIDLLLTSLMSENRNKRKKYNKE